MFRWIIGTSLNFRFIVIGIAAALILFGTYQLNKLPVDVFPEYAPPTVTVQTEAIGLSADEVESLITLNLEELLSGVPWLDSIRSESVTGLSSIVLTFKRGTEIMKARQMIQERLTLAYTLPNVATPPVILQPVSATSRFMMIAISSSKIDPTELSLLARWTIKPRLVGVPGVANVSIWGQRLRQMHVQIDPNRLHDARLMQEDIITAAGDALWVSPLTFLKGSAPGTGGWIDNRNQRLGVQHAMPIESPEEMAKVAVVPLHLLMTGKNMTLGDVAEVTFAHPPLIGDAIVRDGNGLMLVIEKFPSANTLEVTRGVDRALSELSRGLPGVTIDSDVFRLASYVKDSIVNLTKAMIAGALLVVLVVGAFMFNWRSALISVITIPLSLVVALIALRLFDVTINTMILAGLIVALSVVIDDSLVAVEKIMERLRKNGKRDSSLKNIILEATIETRKTGLYGALIVMLAVTPVFFMGGVATAFFQPLAIAYLLAIAASMIITLTITPALTFLFFRNTSLVVREAPLATWLIKHYDAALTSLMDRPRKIFITTGLIGLAALAPAPFLNHTLLPELQERQLQVNWATAPGTSHEETYRITSRVTQELRALPGVRYVGAHVGRAVTGDQVVGINSSQIWISIDPKANYDKTLATIQETIDGYPGIEHNVQHYLRDKVAEALTGQSKAVVVRIYGNNRETLQQKAEEVRLALTGIEGIRDLASEGQRDEPQIQVKVNLDAAGKANVKPGDVRRSSSTIFSGLVVGYLFKDQKIFEVVVWGAPETRQSLSNLRDLWIEKPDRTYARLSEIADIGFVNVPTVLRHERIAPYVDVSANITGRNAAAVIDEIDDKLEEIQFPLEHHPELLGEYVERQKAQQRLLAVAAAVLIGIFLLLQACFRNWYLALIVFLAIPVSIVGGLLGAFATGGMISLGSVVGFLAVLGIAVRNGILLINHYQDLELNERMSFTPESIRRATSERLLQILTTSAAIIAAMLPLIFFGKIAGLEIIQPMAAVIIGGLIASTLLTLFVMPSLYLAIGSKRVKQSDSL